MWPHDSPDMVLAQLRLSRRVFRSSKHQFLHYPVDPVKNSYTFELALNPPGMSYNRMPQKGLCQVSLLLQAISQRFGSRSPVETPLLDQ